MPPLEITPPPTVEFPKGIKLIRAGITRVLESDHEVLSCLWEVHGRQKYSRARAPAMIVLNDPLYWSHVIHQLQTHLEQTGAAGTSILE